MTAVHRATNTMLRSWESLRRGAGGGKQGQEKFKLAEFKNEHAMTIAGSRQYATVVQHWEDHEWTQALS
jgi:hypothetical protein